MDSVAAMTPSPHGSHELDPARIAAFLHSLFTAAGASNTNARIVVDHLLDASRVGLHSHGVLRAPDYLDHVEQGVIAPDAEPRLEREDGSIARYDAARCFGQVAGRLAVDEALRRAEAGSAVVTVRRAGHLGRIGAYVEELAAAGLFGLAFCSVPARYHNVAWYGTRDGCLGTNPIAYAFPTRGAPVVADFSTSALPEGKIRFLRNRGLAAPDGALRDAAGRPTTDPAVLYADRPGTLQPLGGPQGHKGSALGLLVEAMGTLLAGEGVDDQARENNLTVVAVKVGRDFPTLASGLVDHVHRAAPLDGSAPPMLPGEPEQRARDATEAIVVDAITWERLAVHAGRRGVPIPA
jgi:LDH2 family malate/lactate/ureidoglycolate dehydrogenase